MRSLRHGASLTEQRLPASVAQALRSCEVSARQRAILVERLDIDGSIQSVKASEPAVSDASGPTTSKQLVICQPTVVGLVSLLFEVFDWMRNAKNPKASCAQVRFQAIDSQ